MFPSYTRAPSDLLTEYAFDHHLKANPKYPAFASPRDGGIKYWNYDEIVPAIHRTARAIADSIGYDIANPPFSTPVVALLIREDCITYFLALIGLFRLGITALPISPRFSPSVVAHILKISKADHLMINTHTKDLAQSAVHDVGEAHATLHDFPTHEKIYSISGDSALLPDHYRPDDVPALLLHSSSSSGRFPKIIPWTGRAFVDWHADVMDYGFHDVQGKVLANPTLELFHSVGLAFMSWMMRTGFVTGVMDPEDDEAIPPVELASLFRNIELLQPDYIYISPVALEIWANDPCKISVLKKSVVITAGRFLNRAIGDMLTKEGVDISFAFGSTESGPLSVLAKPEGEHWEYWRIHPRPEVKIIPRQDGYYEIIVVSSERKKLPISNSIWEGQPAYNLGDFFESSSSDKNAFRIIGRLSDQIMLASGETFNPVPIENKICEHPSVAAAVAFGRSRHVPGLIVQLENDGKSHLTNGDSKDELINGLWEFVEEANEESPSYARVSKSMIIIADDAKPFPFSNKGVPQRPFVWNVYQSEIDQLYASMGTISKY